MSKKVEYCTLNPDFPQKAFLLILFILHQDKLLGTLPVESIFTTADEAANGILDTVKQFETLDQEIVIPEECLLIPLEIDSLYPLRKEFWTNPTAPYNSQMRMKTFSPIIDHPNFYSLLVTPYAYNGRTKKWQFQAALPLIDTKNTALIEQFMLTSDHVVEPRAKTAAFYTMKKKLRFNWQTKEIKEFDITSKKLLGNYN